MTDNKDEKEIAFFTNYINGGNITPSDEPKKKLSMVRMINHYFVPKGENFRPKW